jgi:hypothetical protein
LIFGWGADIEQEGVGGEVINFRGRGVVHIVNFATLMEDCKCGWELENLEFAKWVEVE